MTDHPNTSSRRCLGEPTSHRTAFAIALAVICAVLVACGPGTGGTGTGPDAGVNTTPGTPASAGQAALLGAWQSGDTLGVFEAQRIQLRGHCAVFVYEGDWSPDANRPMTLAVRQSAVTTGIVSPEAATLEVSLQGADTIGVVVRDVAGRPLIGPLELRRLPGQGVPATLIGPSVSPGNC